MAERTFTANADLYLPGSFTANAVVERPVTYSPRNQHDREEWHFGLTLASDVDYDDTTTLQEQLRDMWDRVAALEG